MPNNYPNFLNNGLMRDWPSVLTELKRHPRAFYQVLDNGPNSEPTRRLTLYIFDRFAYHYSNFDNCEHDRLELERGLLEAEKTSGYKLSIVDYKK